ncbi:hypothetical protein [Maridesulfovibrio sp.]|uniref:hypothetical protein n=1 Tax=Maridesulfovibrio sp. TaxID=2795000 RepID=UPI002A187C6D|nr:hypothetical protein [Maridesulfovibrio sp.]
MRFFSGVFTLLIALLVFTAASAFASTINANGWYNENSNVYAMQIWVNDPGVSIKDVKINSGQSSSGWSWRYTDDTKTSAVFSGPEADFKTLYTHIQFDSPKPDKFTNFSVDWAEVSEQTTLTGTNFYKNKKWTFTSGEIDRTPTPIPGAVLLFGGGLSLVALFRRKFRRA